MRTRGGCRECCMVNGASPEGKEVQATLHQSGNDLWPFGIIQTIAQLQTWHGYFHFSSKARQWNPALCFSHLQQHCRSYVRSEITLCLLSPCFSRYQIPLTQNVHPNSLSSPRRCVYETSFISLCCTCRTCEVASEKLLKVGPLQLFDSGDKSHSLWKFGCICKEPECTVQLPPTFMLHIKRICTCGMQNYTKHVLSSCLNTTSQW